MDVGFSDQASDLFSISEYRQDQIYNHLNLI